MVRGAKRRGRGGRGRGKGPVPTDEIILAEARRSSLHASAHRRTSSVAEETKKAKRARVEFSNKEYILQARRQQEEKVPTSKEESGSSNGEESVSDSGSEEGGEESDSEGEDESGSEREEESGSEREEKSGSSESEARDEVDRSEGDAAKEGEAATPSTAGAPLDGSILKSYSSHIASHIWIGKERKNLKAISNGKKLILRVYAESDMPTVLRDVLHSSTHHNLLGLSYNMLDRTIIFAWVERWYKDTNSFHSPFGEMTITLDDVASILHLSVDGKFVDFEALSVKLVEDKVIVVETLKKWLGVTEENASVELKKTRLPAVRFSWLSDVYTTKRRGTEEE